MESKTVPSIEELIGKNIAFILMSYKIDKDKPVDNFRLVDCFKAVRKKIEIERTKAQIEILLLLKASMCDHSHIAIIDKKLSTLRDLLKDPVEHIEWVAEDFQIDYVPQSKTI